MAKQFPEDFGRPGAERRDTPFKPKAPPSEQETMARQSASLRKVPVIKLRPHRLQPAERHADENVRDLMESIRAIGLQEPPLVRRMPDGTYVILAGHRRVRAWELLALAGQGEQRIPAFVREDLSDLDALMIVAAEYFHRQKYTTEHAARIVVELWEAWRTVLGREPSRRELARALPWERTWVSALIKIHEGTKQPEVAARVQRLDSPDNLLLASILGIEDFASKLHALDVYIEKGKEAAQKLVTKDGRAGGKGKRGRPAQVVTRSERKDGRIHLGIRYRPSMSAEEAREALDAIAEIEPKLRARAEGGAGPDRLEEARDA